MSFFDDSSEKGLKEFMTDLETACKAFANDPQIIENARIWENYDNAEKNRIRRFQCNCQHYLKLEPPYF